jgi:hypothetical protein
MLSDTMKQAGLTSKALYMQLSTNCFHFIVTNSLRMKTDINADNL